jgi:hypothetical protein
MGALPNRNPLLREVALPYSERKNDARVDAARAFYLHHAEFLESPVDPLHLPLPMKTIASEIEHVRD